MLNIKVMMILMAILFTKESTQCDHGEVRIVPLSQIRNYGKLEICINSNWGTVCNNSWDNDDASVVCYQLGYGRDDALAFLIRNGNDGPVLIDEVDCDSSHTRLIDCSHNILRSGNNSDCDYAGVLCSGEQLRTQNFNVSAVTVVSNDSKLRTSIIGGVLGSIIAIFLLIVCGGALLYLLHLRSKSMTSTRSPQNAVELPVNGNSYVTAPSTASGAQATDTVDLTPGAATEYSRIGPSYETITNSGRQPPLQSGGNRVSDSLSERYEFSEPHLATGQGDGGGGSGGGVGQREAAPVEYEVPLQSGEHTEYSHLQR